MMITLFSFHVSRTVKSNLRQTMKTRIVTIPTQSIKDWETFHSIFQKVLGFPSFYGKNMDAWIDCMTYIDDPSAGMTTITIDKGDIMILKMIDAADFKKRCPDEFNDLLECSAFVNYRRIEIGEAPVLSLMLIGQY